MPAATKTSASPFEDLLATSEMPEPGPAYFHARRALWSQSQENSQESAQVHPRNTKLAEAVEKPGAEEDDELWECGVRKIWERLVGGARLKAPQPLSVVIKVLLAGWIRDGTWPRGGVAPDPDDTLQELSPSVETPLSPTLPGLS